MITWTRSRRCSPGVGVGGSLTVGLAPTASTVPSRREAGATVDVGTPHRDVLLFLSVHLERANGKGKQEAPPRQRPRPLPLLPPQDSLLYSKHGFH